MPHKIRVLLADDHAVVRQATTGKPATAAEQVEPLTGVSRAETRAGLRHAIKVGRVSAGRTAVV